MNAVCGFAATSRPKALVTIVGLATEAAPMMMRPRESPVTGFMQRP